MFLMGIVMMTGGDCNKFSHGDCNAGWWDCDSPDGDCDAPKEQIRQATRVIM